MRAENVLFSKDKNEIRKIYFNAFPKEERMPFPMMQIMSCLWNTQFKAFYDGETLCGFVYMATVFRTTFIMFFAVNENLRNQGYGAKILEEVQRMHPNNKIIVSIDPHYENCPQVEMNLRRRGFYIRNGYAETGYFMRLGGQDQEILCKNGEFSSKGFFAFFLIYSCLAIWLKIWKGATPKTEE